MRGYYVQTDSDLGFSEHRAGAVPIFRGLILDFGVQLCSQKLTNLETGEKGGSLPA